IREFSRARTVDARRCNAVSRGAPVRIRGRPRRFIQQFAGGREAAIDDIWGPGMRQARFSRWGLAVLAALPFAALAADPKPWQLNMGRGVTSSAQNAYEAHMMAFWICAVIGAVVFAAMGYAMFKFRHSKGAVPDTSFTHSTRLEILWTVIPVV